MTRILWSATSVKEKIKALPTHAERKRARKARKYLVKSDESSYADFYKKHKAFLVKKERARRDDSDSDDAQSSDGSSSAMSEIPVATRRLQLGFIETVGIECAIWPHLYWATEMCETAVRAKDVRRAKRPKDRDETSSEEDERDDSEGDSDGGDHDAAKQYMTKVLSPLIGYGTDYALFQFVYDLHMWTMLGAKKHVRGGEVPLRVLLKGASFSPLHWRLRHLALIDAQRQLGYPTLFYHDVALRMVFPVPPVDA